MEQDIDAVLDTVQKYEVYISTDGKCTIKFNADHAAEIVNTLDSLVGAWGRLKTMAGDAKAATTTKVNDAIKKDEGSAGICPVHSVPMSWGIAGAKAKTPGAPYKYHMVDNERCFGRR